MSASTDPPKPTVGILSIGEMGMGIAKLLIHHGYTVTTCTAGRSKHTLTRIESASITTYDSDSAFLAASDIVFSIVPPRDAVATAQRILEASRDADAVSARFDRRPVSSNSEPEPLIFIDFNAISPKTVRGIASIFTTQLETPKSPKPRRLSLRQRLSSFAGSPTTQPEPDTPPEPPTSIPIHFLDGGIIGPPPRPKSDTDAWTLPSLPISGPSATTLPLLQPLLPVLNISVLGPDIGLASTLKSSFASLTKGLTALSILSFTTAHFASPSLLPHLTSHLQKYAPKILEMTNSMTGMPPKAYRWVDEMKFIGNTFADVGDLECGQNVFDGIAEVYRTVAEDTVLGEERTEARKRGRTVEDVAEAMVEGVKRRRMGGRKASGAEGGEKEKLELAWRGSWS